MRLVFKELWIFHTQDNYPKECFYIALLIRAKVVCFFTFCFIVASVAFEPVTYAHCESRMDPYSMSTQDIDRLVMSSMKECVPCFCSGPQQAPIESGVHSLPGH